MSLSKKIIIIDFNIKNAHRFIALQEEFKRNNLELKFICEDKNFLEKEKKIKGLKVKNFHSYPSQNYLNILQLERPDLVLVINIHLLKNRSINRCCKFLKIPIVLLEHGISSVTGFKKKKGFDSIENILKRYKRIIKGNLFKEYRSYLNYLFATKSPLEDYFLSILEVLLKLIGRQIFTQDWIYSSYCVFLDSDKKKLIQELNYSIDKEKIFVVGNYDLTFFDLKEDDFNSYDQYSNSKLILYFDSDGVHRTFKGNLDKYLKYMKKINTIVNFFGFTLKIKLHPNSLMHKLDDELSQINIFQVNNQELLENLRNAKYIITEPSSISALGCLIGIPLITPSIHPFNKKRYGFLLDNYPSKINFNSYEDLKNILKNIEFNSNKNLIEKWIKDFAGPLPPSDFPKRVLSVIKMHI